MIRGWWGAPARMTDRSKRASGQAHRAHDVLRVLVVSDGALALELTLALEAEGMVALAAGARDAAARAAEWQPDVVAIDAALPEATVFTIAGGLESLRVLVALEPSGELLSLANRAGLDGVVSPPIDRAALVAIVASSRQGGESVELPSRIVGSTPAMCELWRTVLLAARTQSSVIITGETGTGKEVVARALHRHSTRREGPFVAVNCAALPDTLLESELFGHERGAFTGAHARREGRFELADGGTLFHDEIGDLPLAVQVKLLRALQERTFERVGGTDHVKVDVRVIAATHRDLPEAMHRGQFRADLFFRLAVIALRVPALRERKGDVLRLWEWLLHESRAREGRRALTTSDAALRVLLAHDWPGNVREVQNAAQHASTMATGDTVLVAHLPDHLSRPQADLSRGLAGLSMDEVERAAILETYEATGNIKGAAQLLGISVRKVQYRLKQYREQGWLLSGARRSSPSKEDASRRARVLLAEDDDDVRFALSDLLHARGYEVIAVPNGRAVLEHIGAAILLERRDEPPDCIISDVRMPGLTGLQLLESMRSRGWTIPIVLMSAFGDDALRAKAAALGATAFLDKPIDLDRLSRVVEEAVAR